MKIDTNVRRIHWASVSLVALLMSEAASAQQTLPAINIGAETRNSGAPAPQRRPGAANQAAAAQGAARDGAQNGGGGAGAGGAGNGAGTFTNASFGRGPTGVDNYFASGTYSSTRTNTKLLDIPQAVSVITQKQLQDRAVFDVRQSLQYTPGVTVEQGEGSRDQILIRGQNTTADFFVDGAR